MKPTNVIEGDSQVALAGADATALHIPGDINIFKAQYGRAGDDLVINAEGSPPLTVLDYFSASTPAALIAPKGVLTGDVVELLAGPRAPGQYAQAGEPDLGASIGRVETLTGSATVTRVTGEVVELVPGQPVYQGDVIETGADTALGLMIVDGTLASMSSGSRMVLNELVYDPGGSTNSMLLSLVQGGFAFITGAVAGSGGIDIRTPVAVMAIRGTAPVAFFKGDSVLFTEGAESSFQLLNVLTGELITEVSSEFGYLLGADGSIEVLPIDPDDAQRINDLLTGLREIAETLGLLGVGGEQGIIAYSGFGDIDGNTTAADIQALFRFLELLEQALLADSIEPMDEAEFQLLLVEQSEEPPPPEPAPIAHNVAASGNEDANSIAIVLSGSDGVESFTITSLPGNGTLYADAGLTTPLQVGDTVAAGGNSATVYFVPDENWNGETEFTYTASSGGVDSAPATATITVEPVNDPAVIGGDTTGTVVEAGGADHNDPEGTPTATGQLTSSDVDNADNVFQAASGDATYGSWTIDAEGNWTYTLDNDNPAVQALNDGDTLEDTFTVYSEDGTAQVVTITIEGTDDAAVIGGDTTGTVVEAGGAEHNDPEGTPTATGQLTSSDVDNADNVFQAASGDATYGSWTIDAEGQLDLYARQRQPGGPGAQRRRHAGRHLHGLLRGRHGAGGDHHHRGHRRCGGDRRRHDRHGCGGRRGRAQRSGWHPDGHRPADVERRRQCRQRLPGGVWRCHLWQLDDRCRSGQLDLYARQRQPGGPGAQRRRHAGRHLHGLLRGRHGAGGDHHHRGHRRCGGDRRRHDRHGCGGRRGRAQRSGWHPDGHRPADVERRRQCRQRLPGGDPASDNGYGSYTIDARATGPIRSTTTTRRSRRSTTATR
jgi:VCBS repeat-containing protein